MSLLALFMVVGGAKFAVQSCIEPAENSKKLKKNGWDPESTHLLPQPAQQLGREEKRRKKPILAARLSSLFA